MKYIHLFEQFDFYDESWQDNLPKEITIIYKNQEIEFIKRAKPNALPHQIQIKYDHKKWGEPDTFEIIMWRTLKPISLCMLSIFHFVSIILYF